MTINFTSSVKFHFSLLFLFLTSSILAQNANDILIASRNKMNSLSSYKIEYSGTVKMPPMNPNTLYSNASVYSKKVESDTLVGINYFIESTRTDCGKSSSYYNTQEFYRNSTGKLKSGSDYFAMSVAGNTGIDFYFMSHNFIIKNLLIKDEAIELKMLPDTLINNNLAFHVKGIFTDKNMINPLSCILEKRSNLKEKKGILTNVDLFIAKSDTLPIMVVYERLLNDELEMFYKKEIESVEINLKEDFSIPNDFNFVEQKPTSNYFETSIDSNWQPSNFYLLNQDSSFVSLNSVNAKKTLLVFGTKGCRGCVKLLPELNAFYKDQNKDEITVLYITLFKNPSALKEYKTKNELEFEMLLGNKELWQEFLIKGFPTLYLLDENKKLVNQFIGSMSKSQLEEFIKF